MARMNRRAQIDLVECTCYHVISRCTRQLHLFGGDDDSRNARKGLLLQQLERLATHSAVGVAGFSVMDNHVHLLLKVDSESARRWSARDVARRWLALHPPRDGYFKPIEVEDEHLAVLANDPVAVEAARAKLMCISQFMKELKQEVSQQINRMDETVGSVWAGRFKCKRVTDEAQLLTTLAYIDLNPFAAGVCDTPEAGKHTSLAARLGSYGERITKDGKRRNKGRRHGHTREQRGWWMTVGGGQPGTKRSSMGGKTPAPLMPGTTLTFGSYLALLDRVARLLRKGKRRLAIDTKPITARIAVTPGGVASTVRDWVENGLPWDRPRAVAAVS